MAAALSPSLNAMAATTVSDFYLPYINPSADQATQMRVSKQATVAWGVVQLAVAIGAQFMNRSVLDAGLAVLSFASGAVLGAFLLGTLAPSVRERDTFAGMIAGLIVMTGGLVGDADRLHVVRADRRGHDLHRRAHLAGRCHPKPHEPHRSFRGGRRRSSPGRSPIACFRAPSIEVGRANGPLATFAAGTLTYEPGSPAVDAATIYDLASLTKVIGTAALMAGEVASGRMRLNDRVRHWIAAWTGEERQAVTLRDLLEHCSGLPGASPAISNRGRAAPRSKWRFARSRSTTRRAPSRSTAIPGFMLLGFAIENAAGDAARSAVRSSGAIAELGADIGVAISARPELAGAHRADGEHGVGEERRGEVHDENARGARRRRRACGTVRNRRRRRRRARAGG